MKEIFVSDVHHPYSDKQSVKLVEQVIASVEPEIIWLGGDIIDFYQVSSHLKDPSRQHLLQADIDDTHKWIAKLRDLSPNAKIYFKIGNHETRLTRYLWSDAPALASLRHMHLAKLLDLAKLDVECVENFERKRIGELWHLHGNEIAGGGVAPAASKLRRTYENIIFGHLHQEDHKVVRSYAGKMVGAWANPCLCDLDGLDYIHHADNWSHGFALISYARSGRFHVGQIPIIHTSKRGRWAMVNGTEFEVK